jgi:hypothetical protein
MQAERSCCRRQSNAGPDLGRGQQPGPVDAKPTRPRTSCAGLAQSFLAQEPNGICVNQEWAHPAQMTELR